MGRPLHKMTRETIDEALQMLARGGTLRAVAAQYGVSAPTLAAHRDRALALAEQYKHIRKPDVSLPARILVTPDPTKPKLPPPHRPRVKSESANEFTPDDFSPREMREMLIHMDSGAGHSTKWDAIQLTMYSLRAVRVGVPADVMAAKMGTTKAGVQSFKDLYHKVGERAIWARTINRIIEAGQLDPGHALNGPAAAVQAHEIVHVPHPSGNTVLDYAMSGEIELTGETAVGQRALALISKTLGPPNIVDAPYVVSKREVALDSFNPDEVVEKSEGRFLTETQPNHVEPTLSPEQRLAKYKERDMVLAHKNAGLKPSTTALEETPESVDAAREQWKRDYEILKAGGTLT